MNEKIRQLKGNLVVSCQAFPHEPLHSPFIMSRMALAAMEGGAYGIRANSPEDIREIRTQVSLPIIGSTKRDYQDSLVHITPTMREIEELMAVRPEIIALDATGVPRPGGISLDNFFHTAKEKYPHQLWMADCSTVEEALHADSLDFDFVATTLVGYTRQSLGLRIEDKDFAILREIVAKSVHPVIAAGNIDTPQKARRAIDLGAYCVIVGSTITKPQVLTKLFTDAL